MVRQSAMVLLAAFTAGVLVLPASAQQPAATSTKRAAYDPNQRVCEDLFIGTRVDKKRFCGTRAEWEALKQQDRDELQRAQRPMQCNKIMGKSC